MKPTYEQLEQERNELAAQVERLRGAITPKVIDLIRCGIGSNYSGPLFDNTMNEYREPLVLALSETPPAALAKLKAQCQAEATDRLFHCLFYAPSSPVGPGLANEIKEWWPKFCKGIKEKHTQETSND